MVKPVKHKPNILTRIKSRTVIAGSYRGNSEGTAKAKPMPADKGKYLGSCNRSACLRPGATWWNHGSYAYYCGSCARELNEDVVNKRDAQQMFGHNLCTNGEYDRNWDYRNNKPKAVPEPS